MSLDLHYRQTILAWAAQQHFHYSQVDCSHFVWLAVRTVISNFPPLSSHSYQTHYVPTTSPLPADLIYFPVPGHIALYAGSGKTWFIGSQTSTGVASVYFGDLYWSPKPHIYLRLESQ
jgi:cell wall-associated NlpC family hydrolase